MVSLYFFLSKTLGDIEAIKGPYFPYVASGLAFQSFFAGAIYSAQKQLVEWRDYNLLEEMLMSTPNPWKILISTGGYDFILAIIKSVLFVISIQLIKPQTLWFS